MMASSGRQSFFRDIRSRELNGFRVRKRPYVGDNSAEYTELGVVKVEHTGELAPPMALSFCQTNRNSHILAVADEEGYITLHNTRQKFQPNLQDTDKCRMSEWVAHNNAIFDIRWIKEDRNLLTASGDQSIKVWDPEEKKCVQALIGHNGSVKTISSHPTNQDVIVSGSRDGSFAIWDLRSSKKFSIASVAEVRDAHKSSQCKWLRRGKTRSISITSVLYLKDEVLLATAGAADSIVKFWDTRNLQRPIIQASPSMDSATNKGKQLHGISCLSQDLNGVLISASCMDNRIYLYNLLQLEEGPVKTFSGCRIDTFFVKSAISPDGSHILSGSSDGDAYIWKVKEPQDDPMLLTSHEGEVTAVDWCPYETGKIATASDDFTVRFWSTQNSCYSNMRSPSTMRRRIMAPSSTMQKKLFVDQELKSTKNSSESDPEISTPESKKKRPFSAMEVEEEEEHEKTPLVATESPSSVLNPPSSLKRKTIKDYFMV